MEFVENKIYLFFENYKDGSLKLLHVGPHPFDPTTIHDSKNKVGFRLAEVQIAGLDRPEERHGTKFTVTAPGYRLKYDHFIDTRNEYGRKLEFVTKDEPTGIWVTSHFQFFDNISVIRTWTVVENHGKEDQTLEYVSSFALTGIAKEGLKNRNDKMRLWIAHNSWQRELQWHHYTLPELGLILNQPLDKSRSSKTISITNIGNWSTKEFLPMGFLENLETGSGMMWQIEHNGTWHWEISDENGHLYLQLSGPSELWGEWSKTLHPGESFTSIPSAVAIVEGGFTEAADELVKYRRKIRRSNADDRNLPVIFNDYMNCLFADPTTEKEIPLIDAAAQAGCEYYVIDAGWYAPGYWWDSVGEWQPSLERFPNGIQEVTDYILAKGMIPGLWLEIEVMGIKCALANGHQDWFFKRHGKPVFDRSRYQLDFQNPEVRAFADSVVDRCVKEYHAGYLKIDYNIEPGIGTETNAENFGDGLLEHERAYLSWLDNIFLRYPNLVIENCSSGGLRMDYALMSRCSLASTSDTEDYRMYASIAANSPSALTPEQAAVWSYPLKNSDREETIFNMVNAMFLRIHQSGQLAQLSLESKSLVTEGIETYKNMRGELSYALPFWPLGPSEFRDEWICLGMHGSEIYLAVWRCGGSEDTVIIPVTFLSGIEIKPEMIYPGKDDGSCSFMWNSSTSSLSIKLSHPYSARIFKLEKLIGNKYNDDEDDEDPIAGCAMDA